MMTTETNQSIKQEMFDKVNSVIKSLQHRHQIFVMEDMWSINDDYEMEIEGDLVRTVDVIRFIKNNPNFSKKEKEAMIQMWDILKEQTLSTNNIIVKATGLDKDNHFTVDWRFHDPLENKLEIIQQLGPKDTYVTEAVNIKRIFVDDEFDLTEFSGMIEKEYDNVYREVINPKLNKIIRELNIALDDVLDKVDNFIEKEQQREWVNANSKCS